MFATHDEIYAAFADLAHHKRALPEGATIAAESDDQATYLRASWRHYDEGIRVLHHHAFVADGAVAPDELKARILKSARVLGLACADTHRPPSPKHYGWVAKEK